MNGKPWTKAEDAVLTQRYHRQKTAVTAKQLGRTSNEVIGRAHRLGLCATRSVTYNAWSPAEDRALRRSYRKKPLRHIAITLKRTTSQVAGRASRLGLMEARA